MASTLSREAERIAADYSDVMQLAYEKLEDV